jgi:hypothetical protein
MHRPNTTATAGPVCTIALSADDVCGAPAIEVEEFAGSTLGTCAAHTDPTPVVTDPAAILALELRTTVRTHWLGQPITAVAGSFGKPAPGVDRDEFVARCIAGEVPNIELLLTADGRFANPGSWHEGPSDIDGWVYYERWTPEGRVAHGYVDPESRRLVQAG